MDYKKDMERCLRYIDRHIKEDITPEMLADYLGYSFFHFCHIFSVWNDMPVASYIRKKRLSAAAESIRGGKRITDAALEYGFETPSGFSKAFKREFGISASEFRSKLKTYETEKGGNEMKVEFVKKGEIKTVGYTFKPKDGGEIKIAENGAYWTQCDYSGMNAHDYAKLAKKNLGDIGMWYHAEKDGSLVYFFGPVVESFDLVPENMIPVTITAAEYAVFESEPVDGRDHKNLAVAAKATWKYIFKEWFETADYEFDTSKFAFEHYFSEEGCDGSDHATMKIYIPVKKK